MSECRSVGVRASSFLGLVVWVLGMLCVGAELVLVVWGEYYVWCCVCCVVLFVVVLVAYIPLF